MKSLANSAWENNKCSLIEHYDVVIVGAGHAGCEAALASARLGLKTILFTVSVDSIALMPCNPNIGGSSKGHLVKEVDALGGEMGKNIDAAFIQSKMLNESKGPAVHSLRAQADKSMYTARMKKVLQSTYHISVCLLGCKATLYFVSFSFNISISILTTSWGKKTFLVSSSLYVLSTLSHSLYEFL